MQKDNVDSLVNPERVKALLSEAEKELESINPEIDYLVECLSRLSELRERKRKLESLVVNLRSLASVDEVTSIVTEGVKCNVYSDKKFSDEGGNEIYSYVEGERNIFVPDVALVNAKKYLRTKNNVNYQIYKAVVFNAGKATTEDIKKYLVKNKIKLPKSGKSFKDVPLKDISSRANYLVRKNLLVSLGSGVFSTSFGWRSSE